MKTLRGALKGFNSSYLEQKQSWIDESYTILKYTCASTITDLACQRLQSTLPTPISLDYTRDSIIRFVFSDKI
jgi:hypothetical protein